MKQIIYVLFALFLIAEISASYDGWIYNGKQFSYNGVDYDVSVSKGGESLLLLGTDTLSIPLSECEFIDFGKVCYNISFYDKDLMEYRAYIYIYDMKPDIRITRTASQTALSINDKSTFTVTLTNKGEKGDISFIDRLPDGAKIISTDNVDDEGNTVSWKGEMKKGEVREMSYEIKAVGKIDSSTKAEVSYFDGFEIKKVFSDAIKLTCSPEIEITITTNKDKYEIGENVNITVFMKNNGKRREFNLTIATPGKLVKRPTDVTDEGWSGSLENKTLKFVIRPKETGVNTISVRLGDEMLEKSILVENKGITFTTSLDTANKIDSGEDVRILARLKNKNAYSSIKNVSLRITSDFANLSDPYHLLIKGNETVILLNSIMQAPQLETEKSYKLKFNLTYLSEDNARFSEKFEKILTVKPSGITVSVEGNGEAYENTPVKYTVTIKNLAGVNINVDFKSILPVQAIGATSFYSTVNKSKSKTFEITVLPGYVEKDTEYILNFSAEYELQGERKSEASKKLKVKPKKPTVTISRSLSKGTMYKGDLADVTYTLSNADTSPVYNLKLLGIKSNRADTLTFFESSLDKLDAGEKTTFSGGQILGKKSGSIGKSILFFEDERNRKFNVTSEDNSIDVKDSNNDVYELEIMQYNDTHISSNLKLKDMVTPSYKPFTSQDHFEYELYGKQARAYSNVIVWKQIINTTKNATEQDVVIQEEATKPEGNTTVETDEETAAPKEKKSKTSVWKAMANWFMGLFKKK